MIMAGSYDAIIIGAGHNGLVTACYLARAGWKVLVLERRHVVGGACVTEEVFPGFKVSTAAYVNSLFRKEIIRDLRLAEHGFEVLERNPASFTPFADGRCLFLGGDGASNRSEIAKFSVRDAENYPKYEAMLERVADVIEPTLLMRPPNLLRPGWRDLWHLFRLGRAFQKMGAGMSEAVEVLTGPARTILDRWFESEQLKATLATDAIIGAFAAPSMRWLAPANRSALRSAPKSKFLAFSCRTAPPTASPWPTARKSAPASSPATPTPTSPSIACSTTASCRRPSPRPSTASTTTAPP
jgi:phytoene dehydrogenase-like protein